MLYILQLIYVREGQEAAFNQFEGITLPKLQQYNGRLLLRIRPGDDAVIEQSIEKPYEIHLMAFAAEEDLSDFMQDEERKRFLHLKEQSISSVLLLKALPFDVQRP